MQLEVRRGSRIKRVALSIAVAIAAINIWTGSPALALWVGSRVQGGGPPTMMSVFVVIVLFATLSFSLVKLLAILNAMYARATGVPRQVRAHAPWLRSMRGERPLYPGERPRFTAPERIVIVVAIAAILVFEVWFFFYSGSPIDQRSGRSSSPPVSQIWVPLHHKAAADPNRG